MGEILTFQPKPASTPVGLGAKAKLIALAPRRAVNAMRAALAPTPPTALTHGRNTATLWSIWNDHLNWEVSARGNHFIKLTSERIGRDYCVTLFPRKGAWSWCIAVNGEPNWSPVLLSCEDEARATAWKALEELETMEEGR